MGRRLLVRRLPGARLIRRSLASESRSMANDTRIPAILAPSDIPPAPANKSTPTRLPDRFPSTLLSFLVNGSSRSPTQIPPQCSTFRLCSTGYRCLLSRVLATRPPWAESLITIRINPIVAIPSKLGVLPCPNPPPSSPRPGRAHREGLRGHVPNGRRRHCPCSPRIEQRESSSSDRQSLLSGHQYCVPFGGFHRSARLPCNKPRSPASSFRMASSK